jgi:hypothetical protein
MHWHLRRLGKCHVRLQRSFTMVNVEGTRDGGLMTACTQPGCSGAIVDGYCDVCGSPAGAPPFVQVAASAVSSVHAPVEEEIPTQRLPRVKMPGQQLSKQDLTNPRPDSAQDYRRRVEEAELPDDVRTAALREVDKLERTGGQSLEYREISIWLDTILDLPWSTKTTDSIDIQGSREVEATLRRLIEPPVADAEEGNPAEAAPAVADVEEGNPAEVEPAAAESDEVDTAEIEPAAAESDEADTAEIEQAAAAVDEADTTKIAPAADTEKVDKAPVSPHHDDTAETPAVVAVPSGGPHPRPQPAEQQVVAGPVLVQTPPEKRRSRSLALAATALVALLIGALFLAASRDGSVTAQSNPDIAATAPATMSRSTSQPSEASTGGGGEESPIQVEDVADSGRPFQPVRIQGRYRGGADIFLRVQREEEGMWVDFPIPTKTDQSGEFTSYVELSQPGRYRLRVRDPDSGVTSKTFVLLIKS